MNHTLYSDPVYAVQNAQALTTWMLGPHTQLPSFVASDEDDSVDELHCCTKNMYLAAPFTTAKIIRGIFNSVYF